MKKYCIWLVVLGNAMGARFDEKQLNALYRNVSGFSVNNKEYQAIAHQGGDPLYGEITFSGLEKLLRELAPTKNDIFYDLGCGVGKLCIQVLLNTPALKCVGIELSATRIKSANAVQQQLEAMKKIPHNKQLYFVHTNIKDADLRDGTIFYMGCYGDEVMKATLENISNIPHAIRLASIRKTIGHPEFILIKTIPIQMTWSDNVPVYIYKKQAIQ